MSIACIENRNTMLFLLNTLSVKFFYNPYSSIHRVATEFVVFFGLPYWGYDYNFVVL